MGRPSLCKILHRRRRSPAPSSAGNGQVRPQTTPPTASRPLSSINFPAQPAGARPTPYQSAQNPTTSPVQGSSQNNTQQPTTSGTQAQTRPNLWDEAMQQLPDEDKRWIYKVNADTSAASSSEIVHDLIRRTSEKREQCQDKGWKVFKLFGRELHLHNAATNAITWLNKFKEIGDVAVQYDSLHAALPWAAVRFILQAAVANHEQMAASLAIIETTARVVHRCEIYEMVYNRDTLTPPATEGLTSALVELYVLLLRGLVRVSKFISRRSPAIRTLYAVFNPGEARDLLSSVEHCEACVEKEVSVCEARRGVAADSKLQEQLQKLLSLLDLEKSLSRVDENVNKILEQMDAQNLIEVLEWISPITYDLHHKTVAESRTKDTCDWLLRRAEFYEWQSTTSLMTLWLRGFPGSGKTYLTSRVVDEIKATLDKEKNDEGFAFFYCSRNEQERREALSVLRSYVRQLSAPIKVPSYIYPRVRELHTESRLKGSGWSLALCKDYLIELFNLFPRTTLILDALDECLVEDREILLDFFDSLSKMSSKPVRIFISSRPEGDIRQRLIRLPNIEILATDNERDIASFVNESIARHGRWSSILKKNQTLKEDIVQVLIHGSKGMFQWAKLQVGQLLNLRTEPELRARLGKLPKDLESAYDDIYRNIEELPECSRVQALRALKWVMCACEPLTSEVLLAAVRLDPEKEEAIELSEPTEDDLLDWCANLLGVDSQQDPPVWRLSHLSVVEYLEARFTLPKAHCFVASASLSLLLATFGDQQDREMDPNTCLHPEHQLQLYVREHWFYHVQTQEGQEANSKLAHMLKTFLGLPGKSSAQYQAWHLQFSNSAWRRYFTFARSPSVVAVFAMCDFVLYTLLKDWWDSTEMDTSLINDKGDNPLVIAAAASGNQICEALIQRGISVNASPQNGTYGSALAAAARSGRKDTIEFLLGKGAEVSMVLRSGSYRSALTTAAFQEPETVEPSATKWGEDNMSLQIGDHGSPLAAAAFRRELKTVKFLLNEGAKVNMPLEAGCHGSALAAAASGGSLKTVRFLVGKGAEVNMPLQAGYYGSALTAAATVGSLEMVEFLLNEGAEVDMPLQAGLYGSALTAAATVGRLKTVKFLVGKWAEVNMPLQAGCYGSALAAAACRRRLEMAEFLLQKGAEVDMPLQAGCYGSALAAAAFGGSLEMVELLVRKGAKVNMPLQAGCYGSALAAAARMGHIKVVQWLLMAGADVHQQARVGLFGNALIAAAYARSKRCVEILLEAGAEPNCRAETGYFTTASWASQASPLQEEEDEDEDEE